MWKRTLFLVLGILILITTVSFIVTNRESLFNSINTKGAILIEMKATEEADLYKMKENIYISTGVDKDDIDIEKEEGMLIIRLELVEADVEDDIIQPLLNEFGNSIEIVGHSSIGKSIRSEALYMIYFGMLFSFLLGASMILGSLLSISKLKEVTTT